MLSAISLLLLGLLLLMVAGGLAALFGMILKTIGVIIVVYAIYLLLMSL